MHATAQTRIAKEAGGEVFEVLVVFLAHRMRCFLKHKKLKLRRRFNRKAHIIGARKDTFEKTARTNSLRSAGKFCQYQRHPAFKRDLPQCLGE